MRTLVAAVIVVGVLAILAAELLGAPARRGRVERVERPRFAAAAAVRVCPLMPPSEDRVTCYGGAAPEPGTPYTLVDEHGVRATAVARSSEAAQQDPCKLGSMHDVVLDYGGGGLVRRPQGFTNTMAIQGVALGKQARILTEPTLRSPSGRDADQLWISLDRDGDARVDLAVTYADCTGQVTDVPSPPSGMQKVTPYCMEYWLKDGLDWKRVNREIYYACW